jgi:hypothetical protein
MKAIFSIVGLLMVVAIVGLLAKKQLTGTPPAPATQAVSGAPAVGGSPQQQVQQMRAAAEAAVQAPRAMPDDK